MNDIFNLERFGRLFIKHTVEHYKSYLMSLIVLMGFMVLGGSFVVYMIQIPVNKSFQAAIFIPILLFAGTFFTSTVFAGIGDKKSAVSALTLPASHLEKYLVAWLYSFVIFLVVFVTVFWAAVMLAVNIQHLPGNQPDFFDVFDRHILEVYILYAFLHAVALFGAIFFEKLHFIKTGFVFFILFATIIFVNKIALNILLGRNIGVPVPFGNVRFIENGRIMDINFNNMPDPYIVYLISVLALMLWVASYYRLKEKQV